MGTTRDLLKGALCALLFLTTAAAVLKPTGGGGPLPAQGADQRSYT